jgi:uncharacterized membrane protein
MTLFISMLVIAILTALPFFELRLSIPFGVLFLQLPFWLLFLIVFVVNVAVGLFAYVLIKLLLEKIKTWKYISTYYDTYVVKLQKRVHPYTEKYGIAGLALFIAIPLPGSGVYSAAVIADVLDMSFKQYIVSTLVGVFIASFIMLVVSLGFTHLLGYLGVTESHFLLIQSWFGL